MGAMRVIRPAAAAAVALLVLVACGCKKKAPPDLVIVSPHNKKIEAEFEAAFRAWHKQQFGADVKIEWRDIGGTTDVTRFLLEQYKRAPSSGIDLYFGGGGPDHKFLTARGITAPVKLPAEIMRQLPETITGVRQYDPDGHWHAAAVSCFGIIYNAKLMREKGMKFPESWDDLASPSMYGLIAAADGTQSGSARAAYEMIIQSEPNWQAGWAKLLKIFANCRRFTAGASDIPEAVANGDILAGAAIDFYAYDQIAFSGDAVAFVRVAGTTAFTPDPISLLKGAPHPTAAKRFIEFVLSQRGQALWCLPARAEDGPASSPLFRQPIRRDVYDKYAGKMLAPLVNPFVYSGDFKYDEAAAGVRISRLLGPLMKAAAIDQRAEMSKAWKCIIDADFPADLIDPFVALPENLAEEATALETAKTLTTKTAEDRRRTEMTTSAWQRYFRTKYNGIVNRAAK